MADPWWLPGCLENLAKLPNGVLCSDNHCTDAQNYYHAVCNCDPPYNNGCNPDDRKANCCSYTATSPIYVAGPTPCYCCCGCFSNDTLIHTDSTDSKAIKEFVVGDLVYVAMDPELKTWDQIPVQFSSGTGPESVSDLIQVRFGDPDSSEKVLASRNQLFMVQGPALKRASKLVPVQDSLVRPDGSLTPIIDLTAGKFEGGVHQISTSKRTAAKWAGHLMVANGVVCGDYALQLSDLDKANPAMLVEDHADHPEFGTRAYAEAFGHLFSNELRAHSPEVPHSDDHAPGFVPIVESTRVKPHDATSFVNDFQADDIFENAPRQPVYSGAGKDILNYLFKLYRGFYPNITFYLDEGHESPNAYSVREYGQNIVVINGGLIRTDAIKYESLAFIIAHQVSVLQGGEPKDPEGYTCRGQADYNSILGIFPYVWFGIYSAPLMQPAIDQVREFFAYISPDNRKGEPGNHCNGISIDCRMEAMDAAYNVRSLPQCAGGPPAANLEVTGAEAGSDGETVTITFSAAIDVDSGENPGAYSFDPMTPVEKAEVSRDKMSSTVTGDFEPDTQYEVDVLDVVSTQGNPLRPSRSSAAFKTPPAE